MYILDGAWFRIFQLLAGQILLWDLDSVHVRWAGKIDYGGLIMTLKSRWIPSSYLGKSVSFWYTQYMLWWIVSSPFIRVLIGTALLGCLFLSFVLWIDFNKSSKRSCFYACVSSVSLSWSHILSLFINLVCETQLVNQFTDPLCREVIVYCSISKIRWRAKCGNVSTAAHRSCYPA